MKVDLSKAKELLLKGDVVAIPTETVYGLGGWIGSHEGLLKIFSTKERPFFDPLIVHVDGIQKAKSLTSNWTAVHELLAKNFWPGPLTLIADKASHIDPVITSGLESVGLRCPNHPLTLELLRDIPGGVAAPSANKFGKTSPTSSVHVEDEFHHLVAVLEGGDSEIGIESSVVGIHEKEKIIEIYRPGFITKSMIEELLKLHDVKIDVRYAQSPVAPGQLKHHYMPKIPLVIVNPEFDWSTHKEKIEKALGQAFNNPAHWDQNDSPEIASRELYAKLRSFDGEGFDLIITKRLPHHDSESWRGIWNRLEKAKSFEVN